MGSCTWFGALSGDGGYRERTIGEREFVCYLAVWRRTGRRKESYNLGVPTAQMPTLLSLELFVAPKNSRMPISARISVTLVLNRNLLSRRHRKITQMISMVCLLDIHSLSVPVSLWQYCTLVFFWQLVASATTHIHLFQEFHHCQHLASPPNLIHLHLFHCRNLTLFWTRGHFYPSSNYL